MKLACITINAEGTQTAACIAEYLNTNANVDILENQRPGGLAALVEEAFSRYNGLIFIMATGIAVRMISPLVRDKYSDPAVVLVDDARRYAISLLSGHEGGANKLAYRVAAALGSEPVITTGTETNKRHTLGIGCRKNVPSDRINRAIREACRTGGIALSDLRCAASVDVKKHEPGLLSACEDLDLPLRFYSKLEINEFAADYEENEVAIRNLGVRAVAEPCALLSARAGGLVLPKTVIGEVTLAIAREETTRE